MFMCGEGPCGPAAAAGQVQPPGPPHSHAPVGGCGPWRVGPLSADWEAAVPCLGAGGGGGEGTGAATRLVGGARRGSVGGP